jgi:hypothetical protein
MDMQKHLGSFLREAAASLRNLALRAPDITNELRRFADELERRRRALTVILRSVGTERRIEARFRGLAERVGNHRRNQCEECQPGKGRYREMEPGSGHVCLQPSG